MTAAEAREAQVEEYIAEGDDGWTDEEDDGYVPGSLTKLKVAYPLMRHQEIVGAGETIDVAATYVKGEKRWIGPEAAHVEDLFKLGMIYGSKEHRARESRQAAVDHGRGVFGTEENPEGRPELGPDSRTTRVVRRLWERPLAGGPKEVLRKEKQESHRDDDDKRVYAGAVAPRGKAKEE